MKHKTLDKVYRLGFWARMHRKIFDAARPLTYLTPAYVSRKKYPASNGGTITFRRIEPFKRQVI